MGRWGLLLVVALSGCERATPAAPAGPLAKPPERLEAADDHYLNSKWGYSIAVPPQWRERRTAASADGAVFEGGAADLRLAGAANAGDVDFRAAVEALRLSSVRVEGGVAGNEYRAVALGDEGFRTHLRLVRNADGALISAAVTYPEHARVAYERIAVATLDTLAVS